MKTVAITEGMTARDVCFLLAEKNHQDLGPNWTIVEKIPDLHLGNSAYYKIIVSIPPVERTLEDHEIVLDATSHWPRDHNNYVLFKNNPEKYYLIKRPQVNPIMIH